MTEFLLIAIAVVAIPTALVGWLLWRFVFKRWQKSG